MLVGISEKEEAKENTAKITLTAVGWENFVGTACYRI